MKIFILRLFTGVAAFVLGAAAAGFFDGGSPVKDRTAPCFATDNLAPVDTAARAAESYAVYSAVLRHAHGGDRQVVIEDATTERPMPNAGTYPFPFAEVTRDLAVDFRWANTVSIPLRNDFDLPKNVDLINFGDISQVSGRKATFWDGFHYRYPYAGGLMTLSAVGFDKRMETALVNVGFNTDGSNKGYFYLLEKADGDWRVADETMWAQ